METNSQTVNGWNEHAKLVLSELKRLNERIDGLEKAIETKIDKHQSLIQEDMKDIQEHVTDLRISFSVLKKDVALKTSGIAFGISVAISFLLKFIQTGS